jgi:signal transduction histidine kinase
MQIRARLTIQFALIVATILFVLVSIIYYSSAHFRQKEFYQRLESRAVTTANLFIVDRMDSTLMRQIESRKRDLLPSQKITVYGRSNTVAYTSNDTVNFPTTPEQLEEIRRAGELKITYQDFELIGLHYPTPKDDFVVVAGAIDYYGKIELRNLQKILLFVYLGGLLAVGLIGWFFAGRALKPINDIVERMKLISATNLQTRLDEGNRKDEIARLSQTFNEMLTRLENAFNLQKTFVANISHELKNPLTSITSQLEVALLRERNISDYQRTLESVLDDIKKLNRASASLLNLASLNADHYQLILAPTRIDELLWASREVLLANHPEFRIEIEMDLPEDEGRLIIAANDHLLGIAFANLIENGCKFSKDNRVKVAMKLLPGQVQISFQDHGIGISENELTKIFQPFYRGQNADKAFGHGIGLSLVRRIVELHRATIAVKSTVGQGTVFTVCIPESA